MSPQVQPLSYRHRNVFFYFLLTIFVAALPFLFLYASGYRFNLGQSGFVSTGGLYVAADKTGAEIYINNELVRETRVFRRAFYAQGLDSGTHKIHVQKNGYHTWTKELPVYPHLVTEAQAFNLPLVPRVRVVTPWRTAAGVSVVTASTTVLNVADVSNQYLFERRAATSTLEANTEYADLIKYFGEDGDMSEVSVVERMRTTFGSGNAATTTVATTTKEWRGVQLFEKDGVVYASYVGNQSSMPYYYCAESFPPYESSVVKKTTRGATLANVAEANTGTIADDMNLEVQTVEDVETCDPLIAIDTAGEKALYFDFFPNSVDLVVLGLNSGIYLSEIDDRAWQNRQPLLKVDGLEVRVVDGSLYAFDGTYIYQIATDENWF